MQSHHHQKSSVKKEFLKKWIMGLQICSSSSKEKLSLLERKKAIKLSADLAMASTSTNGTTSWSHALITKASSDRDTGALAKQILGHNKCCLLSSQETNNATTKHYITKQKHYYYYKTRMMIFGHKKSSFVTRKKRCKNNNNYKMRARSMAKRLIKKRTQVLKGLIPGGEYIMDEYSLVKETLDYVVSLRAQVDVMNHLANLPSSTFYYS